MTIGSTRGLVVYERWWWWWRRKYGTVKERRRCGFGFFGFGLERRLVDQFLSCEGLLHQEIGPQFQAFLELGRVLIGDLLKPLNHQFPMFLLLRSSTNF
jgi:hypothetical protein